MNRQLFKELQKIWQFSLGNYAVKVAIIDGAVDESHPSMLQANLTYGYPLGNIGSGFADHGTHVASIIFGQHHTNVKGIAPSVSGLILPIFGADDQGNVIQASQMDLARAINMAIDQGAHIINISAGELHISGEPDIMLSNVLRKCEENHILVIAAAGNNGCECLHIPASFPTVMTVGAVDENGQPLQESNWGSAYIHNGIVALGKQVYGALPNQNYGTKTGTSFATPIVSGVAALLLSIQQNFHGGADPLQIREILRKTALPCPHPSDDTCVKFLGGQLNIEGALNSILSMSAMTLSATSNHSENKNNIIYQPLKFNTMNTNHLHLDPSLELANNLVTSGVTVSEMPERQVEIPEQINQASEQTLNSEVVSPPNKKVTLSELTPSCGGDTSCSCGGNKSAIPTQPAKMSLVYALGTVGYDFVSASRKDSFLQHIQDNLSDPAVIIKHLESGHLTEATELIWTLEQEGTPIYAIHPHGPFARDMYQIIIDFMKSQLTEGVERVAIPGIIAGNVTLSNGQSVPAIAPTIRGMASWNTKSLVASTGAKNPAKDQLSNFLERIYHEFRNFGTSSQDRALNFAATNAFQANNVFQKTISEGLQLTEISVNRSPIVRPGVDGWDVLLTFFDPKNRMDKARKIFRYTVDVTDVIPVTMGSVRSWSVY